VQVGGGGDEPGGPVAGGGEDPFAALEQLLLPRLAVVVRLAVWSDDEQVEVARGVAVAAGRTATRISMSPSGP
jgi:hypothetical protein